MNRLSWDKIQTRPRVNLKRLRPYSTESERRRIDMEVLKQKQLCKNSNNSLDHQVYKLEHTTKEVKKYEGI